MFKEERIHKIHELLKKQNFISVKELSFQFSVSEMTIRRDLQRLDSLGLITRVRGGAQIKKVISAEEILEDKQSHNLKIKKKIAKKAIHLLKDGMTLLLDSGTTTYEIALLIHHSHFQNLTVITNDLEIVSVLRKDKHIQLIVLGGWVQSETQSTQGNLTKKCMEELQVEIAFLGASSIGKGLKTYSPSEEKVELKRLFIENSALSVLVVDASKREQMNLNFVHNVIEVDYLITDLNLSQKQQELLKEENTQYIQV